MPDVGWEELPSMPGYYAPPVKANPTGYAITFEDAFKQAVVSLIQKGIMKPDEDVFEWRKRKMQENPEGWTDNRAKVTIDPRIYEEKNYRGLTRNLGRSDVAVFLGLQPDDTEMNQYNNTEIAQTAAHEVKGHGSMVKFFGPYEPDTMGDYREKIDSLNNFTKTGGIDALKYYANRYSQAPPVDPAPDSGDPETQAKDSTDLNNIRRQEFLNWIGKFESVYQPYATHQVEENANWLAGLYGPSEPGSLREKILQAVYGGQR